MDKSTANKLGVCINGTVSGVFTQSKHGIYYISNDIDKMRIECKIPTSLLDIADRCLNKECEISGIFYYRNGDWFPYEIEVSDIENITDSQPVSFSDVFVGAPDSTGDYDW